MKSTNTTLHVFPFEGVHGVGKTTTMKEFAGEKILGKSVICMDESFVPTMKTNFAPQGVYSETCWTTDWFKRLEYVCKPYYNEKTNIYSGKSVVIVADRSPFSSIMYVDEVPRPSWMFGMIKDLISRFKEKNIHIHTIHLTNDQDVIWEQIVKRLESEQWRKKLNEHKKDWFLEKYELYNKTFSSIWDTEIYGDFKESATNFIQSKIV